MRFRGRYQQDFATVDADQGDHEEWNVRRLRSGLQAYMFGSLLLHAEVDLNPQEADPVYVRFTDMYAEWTVRPEEFYSKSRNTPFAGRRLKARPDTTIVRGQVVFARGADT